jgi:hypothetical protein
MSMSNARVPGERRAATRIYSTLALVYKHISGLDAGLDPYDTRFGLPQHFTLAEELAQVDSLQRQHLDALQLQVPQLEGLIATINQKFDILARTIGGSLSHVVSPAPQNVNLSESGLSFHAAEPLLPGVHLHLAISNTSRNYHIAATGRVVFCEEEDLEGYRTGVAFVTLRDDDRQILARDVIRKVQENEVIQDFLNPENG